MATRRDIAGAAARIVFAAVFAVNVQCALSFICAPADFAAGFMLEGTGRIGETAVAGLGVAFLMWNATYPAFIVAPRRFPVLGWVILAQQAIGLIGESALAMSLGSGYGTLQAALLRFIVFDGAGLILMGASFAWLLLARKRPSSL